MNSTPANHPYLSPAKPHIFAHRGFAAENGLIENTLKAFDAALLLGATHIESDIQVTKDGVPVLFHDNDLERVAGLPLKVNELYLTDLLVVDLGGGSRIPTLEQALTLFPTARFNLDFKVSGAISPAAEVIARLQATDRVLIASFSDSRRKRAQALLGPASISSAGGIRVLLLWLAAKLRQRWLVKALSSGVRSLQIPVQSGPIVLDSPGFIEMMKTAGLELNYWTINEAAEMKRLIDLGADGIVTDRTDIAVNTLRTAS